MNLQQLFAVTRNTPGLLYLTFPLFFQLALLSMNYYSYLDESIDRVKTRFFASSQGDTFDFIVVGGGSTGSVVANRLSEHFKVLLLEAGGNPNPFNAIPLMAFLFYGKIPEDWKYQTVPQTHAAFGLKGNRVAWPSGKGLGGSGLIHGMIYIRGTVQGFDIIANQTNDPVWSMENVLNYYRYIENYHGHFENDGGHGRGGRLSVGKGHLSAFVDNFLRAGAELGYPTTDPNANAPLIDGFAPMDLYISESQRWSTWNAYIKPYLNTRPNFVVRRYAYGYKVLIDGHNRAIGVEYLHHGQKKQAFARKEVILSAGAVQSPKILMLSGIGPRSELQRLNIPVRVNLPVGQHLQDKYGSFVGPFVMKEGTSVTITSSFRISSMLKWLITKSGEIGSSGTEGSYSITTNVAKREGRGHTPDIHTYILSLPTDPFVENILYEGSFNIKPEAIRKYYTQAAGKNGFMQLVNLAKPLVTGTLTLQDSNPTSPPLIDPKYLADKKDVEALVEAAKFAVKLVEETQSFREINASLIKTPFPGCEQHEYRSDQYWECLVRYNTATAYKYCGTAPIGKDRNDPLAVVDSRLRVFGVKNLRVVDGSVLFERYVSVNHVTCVMLGELASDFILRDYNIRTSPKC